MASCLVPDPCSEYRSGITNYFRTKKDNYLVLRGGYYNVAIKANLFTFQAALKTSPIQIRTHFQILGWIRIRKTALLITAKLERNLYSLNKPQCFFSNNHTFVSKMLTWKLINLWLRWQNADFEIGKNISEAEPNFPCCLLQNGRLRRAEFYQKNARKLGVFKTLALSPGTAFSWGLVGALLPCLVVFLTAPAISSSSSSSSDDDEVLASIPTNTLKAFGLSVAPANRI